MEIKRGEQLTVNGVPTKVRGKCPKCGLTHNFELLKEGIVPD